ncbi:MAG: sn-glycerol-1-phosphate dehydrogenase [Clostridia bacterium]|nr:sn-glycerol-1-phosphate dehydrogenase [Clostridia bacterium]
MDINKLLAGVACSCGKTHTCDIEYVYIEKNAIRRLGDICRPYRDMVIVADENTFAAAGDATVAALADKTVKRVIFSGAEVLVPNEAAIATVTDNLANADLIVGIGSGVIQDLCKYVSHQSGVPYIVVATAPSMDGYASDGAAMITDGMKVTYPSGLPRAIVADVDVLKNAPMEMIKAGYGDVIGKFSALNDWKLSRCVNGEYFCDYIYDLTFAQIQQTLATAEGILKRDEDSVRALMEALVVIGILMSFAGSSRPASGSEHHLSHFFEITGIIDHTAYFPHGLDVAYSTVVTAEIREKLLAAPFPQETRRFDRQQYEARMRALYKEVADGCMELQRKIGRYEEDRLPIYREHEAEIRRILAEMPSADEIKRMLALAEIDMQDFYDLYGEKKIADAVAYAKDLKDRYTVLWMNADLGGQSDV